MGLSVGTIILPPFPSFLRCRQKMLINKRRNSDPAPAVNNGDLDISAPRQTEKTATELCSFAIIWWTFLGLVRFFKVDGIWGPEGGVSRRMVEKKLKL